MYCSNCGSEVEDGFMFCNKCGSPVTLNTTEANIEPQPQSYAAGDSWQAPQDEQGSRGAVNDQMYSDAAPQEQYVTLEPADNNMYFEEFSPIPPERPKKKLSRRAKRGIIAGCGIGAACIAVALTFVVAGAQIRNFFNSLKSPEDYFRIVQNDAIDGMSDNLLSAYDSYKGVADGDGTGVFIDSRIELGSMAQSFLAIAGREAGTSLSNLKSIQFSGDLGARAGTEMGFNGEVKVNDESFANVRWNLNTAEAAQYFNIPDFMNGFLKIKLDQRAITAFQKISSLKDLPDAQLVRSVLNRYLNIVYDNMKHVDKTSEALSAEGVSEDCTSLLASFSGDEVYNILKAWSDTARNDEELKTLFTAVFGENGYAFDSFFVDGDQAGAGYQSMCDSLAEKAEKIKQSIGSATALSIKLYVDNKGRVKGLQLMVANKGCFLIALPVSGGKFGFTIMDGGDENSMKQYWKGFGEAKGDKLTGTFSPVARPTSGFGTVFGAGSDVRVEDFDIGELMKGRINGTIIYNLASASGLIGGAQISIDMDSDLKSSEMKVGLSFSGMHVFTYTMSAKVSSYPSGTEPVGEKVYDASVPSDMNEFKASLKLDEWIARVNSSTGIDFSFIKNMFTGETISIGNS
ncbi:MAG: zinc ribbon domain-containing protein [Eubacterium sp.]|nr:zinc ribbon domain-containing protein [Eubacterium sp.]